MKTNVFNFTPMNSSTAVLSFRVPYEVKLQLMQESVDLKKTVAEYLELLINNRNAHNSMNLELKAIGNENKKLKAQVAEYIDLEKKIRLEAEKAQKIAKELERARDTQVSQLNLKIQEGIKNINELRSTIDELKKEAKKHQDEVTRLKRIIAQANDILERNNFKIGSTFFSEGQPYKINY